MSSRGRSRRSSIASAPAIAPVIALVGNAPTKRDFAARVDSATSVVRLNNARGFGGGMGRRTDMLVLVNCGGQMREWLDDRSFDARPAFRAAPRILLPIHPDKDRLVEGAAGSGDPDAANHADEAVRRFEAAGKKVAIFPTRVFRKAAAAIGHPRLSADMPAPSTGLLTLVWLEEAFPKAKIEAFGFGFGGWAGHAWDAERAYFEKRAGQGALTLHPV